MQYHTLEEKITHVTRWRASGLTGQQYAKQNDIRYGSFKNWSLQIKKAQASPSNAISPLSQPPKQMSSNHAHMAKPPNQSKAISDPSTVASPVATSCLHSQSLDLASKELNSPEDCLYLILNKQAVITM